MCGIAGILGVTDPVQAEKDVRAMIERIAHRGPNGIRVESGPGWCVAHARLSIIDLEGGWQPLHGAGSTVIGNGEIYNYLELADEFQLKDRLATGSDFEPLLHIYAQEGEKAFERLRGMYAFCFIGCDGRTWLVRDGFGIKPLYTEDTSSGFRFASEPRALGDVAVHLGNDRAEEILTLGYGLGADGYESGVNQPPGTVAFLQPNGIDGANWAVGFLPSILTQAPPSPAHPRESGDPSVFDDGGSPQRNSEKTWIPAFAGMSGEEGVLARLDAVLEDSVKVHQRSDVPYGLFLSGGIDSTTIATLMSRLNERPVTAYTCGFDAPEARDERGQAEKVAKGLNLDWRETTFGEEDFWRIAPQVANFLDDPTTDYACLPTYKLAEAAKGTLTVVLSGEGGDELFGGYGRYRRALRPSWLGGRAAEPQIDAAFLKDGGKGALTRWREAATPPPGLTPLQQAQYADIVTWLPNDLLLKLDRMLMAHGLEGRTPFLDKEVAAFAFNLPDRMKVRGKYGKYILRKWLERHCPAAEPWAKKKGFTVPVASWIAPRAGDLGPRVADVKAVAEVCDIEAVRAVFGDEAQAHNRWPLLFFALWSLIHLEGAEPDAALASLLGSP